MTRSEPRRASEPRAVLVDALTDAVRDAMRSGDVRAGQVAHEALGKLIAPAAGDAAAVVDLNERRRR